MDNPSSTPEDRYAALVETLLKSSDATFDPSGKGFGSSALKVDGKIFAMLVTGRLVVKLPQQRVDALIAAGEGERFDPGHGRVMKEWLAVDPASEGEWVSLANEAMAFVASHR